MNHNFKTLKQVRSYINSYPDINLGGCVIAALAMYRWLEANGKLSPNTKIVFLYTCGEDYRINSKVITGEFLTPTCCQHAVLRHRGYYIDSEGTVNTRDYLRRHILDDDKFLLKAINNIPAWNIRFNRGFIPAMAEALGIDMSDIKLERKWQIKEH